MIDKNKIVFITVDWMKNYQGITEKDIPIGTGGSYPKEQKHEVFNFLDEDGVCYGYTPPYGRINLKKICKDEIKESIDGNQYLDNVLVVFNASKDDGKKRRVVGFYVDAMVFSESYENKNPKRIIAANNSFVSYNIRVKAENAYLFENDKDRNIFLPYARQEGYGYGQSNIWYANTEDCEEFRDFIINNVTDIINNNVDNFEVSDEEKYLEGEVKATVKRVYTIKRNAYARKKCLQHYFPDNKYRCLLCDFDFKGHYGQLGEDFIEVHHIESHTTLSKTIGVHEIDPIKDLIPICSNCHSIIHRESPPVSIERIKKSIKSK